MMTDPIADMLTRIRNSNALGRKTVDVPASKMKVNIAEVLKREGFITNYHVEEMAPRSVIRLELRYGSEGEKAIRTITRVSKPGCRVYAGAKEMKPLLRGQGIYVLSTPKGILSDRDARKENVGGEVVCKVW
ncbi:MAG: 30S ribosomal protein S8 [Planctomycetes bacterium]|nr:30S ribosomal protein S8 [Planctomycetota bacterium]